MRRAVVPSLPEECPICGCIFCGGSSDDYYTAKYAAANGALLWEKRYNGPASANDFAAAVALDGKGDVIVTGSSDNGPPAYPYVPDYYTAKYAGTNGALLWEQRYNGPSNSDDSANALAVDSTGNVIVTGSSQGNPFTIKYASTNGAVLWQKRNLGTGEGSSVAVDENDNVIVAGCIDGFAGNYNYYTAKYSGADGALIWDREYNGPISADDFPSAHGLAIGSHGIVVVTGASGDSALSNNKDYGTVVYWEKLPATIIDRTGGAIRLRFPTVANKTYNIERASTPTGPWSTNATLSVTTNGIVEYIDTNAPPGSAFYRTSAGP